MAALTVDIVLLLPAGLREAAVATSTHLADRMATHGHPSAFTLGHSCEPHVSLFMLTVDEPEIAEVVRRTAALARRVAPVEACGAEFRHNPVGAPELHLAPSAAWTALQEAVVREIGPLRRGRLRPTDPAGADLPALVARLHREDPGGLQTRQLLAYGYDEIGARFSPHVTYAWPLDEQPTPMTGLPTAAAFRGRLDTLAVYGMGGHGTCVTPYAEFRLRTRHPRPAQEPQHVRTGVEVTSRVAFGRPGPA